MLYFDEEYGNNDVRLIELSPELLKTLEEEKSFGQFTIFYRFDSQEDRPRCEPVPILVFTIVRVRASIGLGVGLGLVLGVGLVARVGYRVGYSRIFEVLHSCAIFVTHNSL